VGPIGIAIIQNDFNNVKNQYSERGLARAADLALC